MKDSTPMNDRRSPRAEPTADRPAEETLVADARAALTPSQHVEQRLLGMLKASPVLVSHVQRQMRPGPR
jgi:hypothetical protein